MAFEDGVNFDDQDPLKKDQAGAPGAVGGEAITSGAPTGTSSAQAGAGPGGTGGWTNIQNYLDANKGGTGSSQLLDKAAGDQFGQERNTFQNDSQNFLTDAQAQANKNNISNDQASGYITQAAGGYQYPGEDGKGGFGYAPVGGPGDFTGGGMQKSTPQTTTPTLQDDQNPDQAANYSGIVDKFQHALKDKYSGPTEYNYGFSNDTQELGNDLNDNGGFDTLMSRLYSKSAGAPLNAGQYQLQKQLDVGNQALDDSRAKQQSDYAQLGADRDKTVQDTTTGLGGIAEGYQNNQNRLNDFLNNQSNAFDTSEAQKEAAARAAYNTTYTGDKSGRANTYYPDDAGGGSDWWEQNHGVGGPNLTWEQLQREQNLAHAPGLSGADGAIYNFLNNGPQAGDPTNTVAQQGRFYGNRDALNNFYASQDQKYQGTADQDKRSYNAIQDFLNSAAARKKQGFAVRG